MKLVLTMPCRWCQNDMLRHYQRIEIAGLALIHGQLRGYRTQQSTKPGTIFRYDLHCALYPHHSRTVEEYSWTSERMMTFWPWFSELNPQISAYETILPGVYNTRGLHNLKEK